MIILYIMKHFYIILLLIALLFVPFFHSESHVIYPSEAVVYATDTIPIIDHSGGGNGSNDPENVGNVPLGCSLSNFGTNLTFYFYSDFGYVSVRVVNLTSGEMVSRLLDSQLGIVDLPISGEPGFYHIYISAQNGHTYFGQFTI